MQLPSVGWFGSLSSRWESSSPGISEPQMPAEEMGLCHNIWIQLKTAVHFWGVWTWGFGWGSLLVYSCWKLDIDTSDLSSYSFCLPSHLFIHLDMADAPVCSSLVISLWRISARGIWTECQWLFFQSFSWCKWHFYTSNMDLNRWWTNHKSPSFFPSHLKIFLFALVFDWVSRKNPVYEGSFKKSIALCCTGFRCPCVSLGREM